MKMIYKISNEKFTIEIDSMGAEMKSVKDTSGKEYTWNSDPKYWNRSAPHLFPVVCSLKDDKAVIDCKTYNIKKHGFARNSEFSLYDRKEDEITFSLKADENTLKCYPYHFELYITHRVHENGFETVYRVKNADSKPMYYAIGGHPSFKCPINDDESFSDYDIVFEKLETNPVYQSTPDDLGGLIHRGGLSPKFINIDSFPLNYDIFKLDAVIFEKINSSWVKLINRNTKKGIQLSFGNFNSLGIWTKVNAPYICLEPWTAISDMDDASGVLTEKPYISMLEPGCDKIYSYAASIF